MNEITERLKEQIEAAQLEPGLEELPFALINAACSGCCEVSNSGNGGCPPPK